MSGYRPTLLAGPRTSAPSMPNVSSPGSYSCRRVRCHRCAGRAMSCTDRVAPGAFGGVYMWLPSRSAIMLLSMKWPSGSGPLHLAPCFKRNGVHHFFTNRQLYCATIVRPVLIRLFLSSIAARGNLVCSREAASQSPPACFEMDAPHSQMG